LFVRDNTMMAQRFNPRSLALEGEAKPVADHVAVNTDVWRSILTASANGELLYQHGAAGGGSQLVWYDASGKQGEPVLPDTADYYWPRLSPDASKLAFALETNGIADIWVVDLARHTKTRLTFWPTLQQHPRLVARRKIDRLQLRAQRHAGLYLPAERRRHWQQGEAAGNLRHTQQSLFRFPRWPVHRLHAAGS
jgi:hypothetical protein